MTTPADSSALPATWIRRALPSDAEAVGRIVSAAYSTYLDRMSTPPEPMLRDYRRVIADDNVHVACVGDEVVGLLSLVASAGHLLVENVAVDPQQQGRGLGRALLAHAELEAEQLGLDELRLYTNAVMSENIAFYERLGYVAIDRRHDSGYDRVFMRKRLTVVRPTQPAP